MVDPAAMELMEPNNDLVPSIKRVVRKENLTDEHFLIWHSMMYGFALNEKDWAAFSLDSLASVQWDDEMLELLVLPDDQRMFIHDLVKAHGLSSSNEFDDFVKNKGKGLVGLLSGSPGIGKTLTAEAIAEVARKPLYKLSSGELGDSPDSLEKRLTDVLKLSQLWGAVLLLDEADVFLVSRTDDSLTRNAITSIFLRELEYYRGILLLTTNRLTSFDPAFQSRIHFCFRYNDLNFEAREKIWHQFLSKIRAQGSPQVAITDDQVSQMAKMPLNGRQIKNILSVSQSVAKQRQKGLDLEVIKLAQRFSSAGLDASG
jgi:replication-associated recombination protein RarA